MDFLQFSLEILLATSLFLLLLLKIRKRSQSNYDSALRLPPGPPRLPLIGNMHQLGGPTTHHALRDMANKYGPLMHLQLGEVSAVVISSSELARDFMQTNDAIFASRPTILTASILTYDSRGVAFAPYGEYWRQLKKLCTTELLSAKRVKSFGRIREDESTRLIGEIAARQGLAVNLSKEIESLVYTITSRAAFGLKCQDQEQFISHTKETIKAIGGFSITDVYPSATWLHYLTGGRSRILKLHEQADKILGKIIDEHRTKMVNTGKDGAEAEAEDLVDVLLKFLEPDQENLHLTMEDIKAVVRDVFVAGSDTTSTTVDWAMSEMMKNPGVLEKAQAEVRQVFDRNGEVDETCITEMEYLKSVIKETLRLHPPSPMLLPRVCGQNCEIRGYAIPAKTKVLVNAWAIARDSSSWTEPERFYPERFINNPRDFRGVSFEYIPFGGGRRMCPGISFGMANVEIILAYLLYHFNWKLPNGLKNEELDMTETNGITVRRRGCLELIPSVYDHSIQTIRSKSNSGD